MNWENLKTEKCPKCGSYLRKGSVYSCDFCNFSIRIGKVYEIVGKPINLEEEARKLLKKSRKSNVYNSIDKKEGKF